MKKFRIPEKARKLYTLLFTELYNYDSLVKDRTDNKCELKVENFVNLLSVLNNIGEIETKKETKLGNWGS